jgi:hypothetical protein
MIESIEFYKTKSKNWFSESSKKALCVIRKKMVTTIQPKLLDTALIFVCHDKNSTEKCLQKYPDSFILFVGPDVISNHPRIIVASSLQYNIEHERKLLTFTAWYAIVKNKLFTNYMYLCIFEYDIILVPNFNINLNNLIKKNYEIISFLKNHMYFTKDIDLNLINSYMQSKYSNYSPVTTDIEWYTSTNHCMRRDILEKFVDFYYPSCLLFKENDNKNFSWYHERIFNLFMMYNNINVGFYNDGIRHLQGRAHGINNINRMY